MTLPEGHSLVNTLMKLLEIGKGSDVEERWDPDEIWYRLNDGRFDRRTVKRRFERFSSGYEVCLYE